MIGNEVFISCYEYDMNSYIFANKSLILILIGGYIFASLGNQFYQAVQDGVDIFGLSIGQNSPPATTITEFFNPFNATLLAGCQSNLLQSSRNGVSFAKTLVSYKPMAIENS